MCSSDLAAMRVVSATSGTPAKHRHKKGAKHHKKKAHHKKHKKAGSSSKATSKRAARTTPSASAVATAISGLKNYVHTPFSPNASQVAEFGDDVCSAFDAGKTYAAVKSEILAKVQQLPFTTVEAGAADYVVKTAVHLYCPGYASRLG